MRFSPSFLLGGLLVLALGVGGLTAACADSEPPDVPSYGPPNGLAAKTPNQPASSGGTSSGGSSSGGSDDAGAPSGDGGAPPTAEYACQTSGGTIVDGGPCAVSWTTDIYPAMQSGGAYNCAAATSCHGTQIPVLTGSEHSFYATLANYTAVPSSTGATVPYFNPCSTNPAQSSFLCNLLPTGQCGALSMPEGAPIADAGMLATWVACGAPEN